MTFRLSLPDEQLEVIVEDYLNEIEWSVARRVAKRIRYCEPEHGWARIQGWADQQLLRMRVEQESAEALLMVFQSHLPVPEPAQSVSLRFQDWNISAEVSP